MKRDLIRCTRCGIGITPEEAEVGVVFGCPLCDDGVDMPQPEEQPENDAPRAE